MLEQTTAKDLSHFLSRRSVTARNVAQFEALLNACLDSRRGCDRSIWPRLTELGALRVAPEIHGRICLKAALAAANPRGTRLDLREWVEGLMIIAEKSLAGIGDGESPQRAAQFRIWFGALEEEQLRRALHAVVETAQTNAFDLDQDDQGAADWLMSGRRALRALQLLDDITGAPNGFADLTPPKIS